MEVFLYLEITLVRLHIANILYKKISLDTTITENQKHIFSHKKKIDFISYKIIKRYIETQRREKFHNKDYDI